MLIRPDRDDLAIIGFYVGKVLFGVGLLLLVPLAVALVRGEWNAASAIAIGAAVGVIAGRTTEALLFTRRDLDWSHGMVIVAASWLLAPAVLAIPFHLSGHLASYTDAYFDAMSGLTTSGLSLLQDLDHLSVSMNLLRHLSHFAGGQGIVIVVLTVFASAAARVGTLYVGEGRDERIVPNVVRTARFIYLIAAAWAVVGTAALWLAGRGAGLTPGRALLHATNLFMAAFDTGGFSTYSTSIAYYHSPAVESVIVALMLAGGLSFPLHFELWQRRLRRASRHLELRSWAASTAMLSALVLIGLVRAGTYLAPEPLVRKGLFVLVSAHTGTGFTVVAGRLFATDWGLFAPAIVVVAMGLGAMAGSTAGGIKMIRIGLVTKSVLRDVAKSVAPPDGLVVASYHERRHRVITDAQVRSAIVIVVLYLLTYLAGALVGVAYGHPLDAAVFESTSAAANVGLSIGVLSPDNPWLLKAVYTLQMWLGRLEFLAAFALVGYVVALVRGRL